MASKHKHNSINITGPESLADKASGALDSAAHKAGETFDAASTKVNETLNAHDQERSSAKPNDNSSVTPTLNRTSRTNEEADAKKNSTATRHEEHHDSHGESNHEHDDSSCDCNLVIDESVVEKIAFLAASKISGIVDMKGSVFSMIQEGLGGNDRTKGTDADIDDGDTTVELSVILKYGTSAVDVFNEIRKIVSQDIREMTGLEVSSLTVNIVDVMDDEEISERYDDDAPQHSEDRKVA